MYQAIIHYDYFNHQHRTIDMFVEKVIYYSLLPESSGYVFEI